MVLNLFERDGEQTFDSSPVIDADGILRHKFIGPYNWDTWEMRSLVGGLFNTVQQSSVK